MWRDKFYLNFFFFNGTEQIVVCFIIHYMENMCMSSGFEKVVAIVPGFDVFGFSVVLHLEW
jgi:hypothetical protein